MNLFFGIIIGLTGGFALGCKYVSWAMKRELSAGTLDRINRDLNDSVLPIKRP